MPGARNRQDRGGTRMPEDTPETAAALRSSALVPITGPDLALSAAFPAHPKREA
jgi:hypothetical protein